MRTTDVTDDTDSLVSHNTQIRHFIPKATSAFLDALRIGAALTVFAVHCYAVWYHRGANQYGQNAVVVFFVLSGYVIAYSTLSKHHTIRDYVTARLARLYSVVIPALLLTLVLQTIGSKLHFALYQSLDRGHDVVRYIMATFFLQEAWNFSASPTTNGPLWSLGYEFWYYAIFGAAILISDRRRKFGAISVILLLAGPKIMLLMPIWLLGVAVFIYGRTSVLKTTWAQCGLVISTLMLLWAFTHLPAYPATSGLPPLYYSGSFISNWLTGCLVAIVIWLFHQSFSQKPVPMPLERGIRWAAAHTFSLYLYHYPLIVFVLAVMPLNYHNPVHVTIAVLGIFAVILMLSTFTEAKRKSWYNIFSAILDNLVGPNKQVLLNREDRSHLPNSEATMPDVDAHINK